MRYIYVFKTEKVADKFEDFNAFTLSELNDLDKLPKSILKLMKLALIKDMVYTIDNFALCYNLEDKELDYNKYVMFVPDKKFKKQLSKYNLK